MHRRSGVCEVRLSPQPEYHQHSIHPLVVDGGGGIAAWRRPGPMQCVLLYMVWLWRRRRPSLVFPEASVHRNIGRRLWIIEEMPFQAGRKSRHQCRSACMSLVIRMGVDVLLWLPLAPSKRRRRKRRPMGTSSAQMATVTVPQHAR